MTLTDDTGDGDLPLGNCQAIVFGCNVIQRDALVQLSITGKGGKVRQVLLPEAGSRNMAR